MTGRFVPFDAIFERVLDAVDSAGMPEQIKPVHIVRSLHGQVRVAVSEEVEGDASRREGMERLERLAARLHEVLGPHGGPDDGGVLFVAPILLENAGATAREIRPGVFLVDRLVTGGDWWTVRASHAAPGVRRITLFSVKGGVGRSTTAAVLARRLASDGQRVLVIDLDLESPGISSAMLEPGASPAFGVTDWFVEDLVGQGEHVVAEMTGVPTWAHDLEGEVRVAPAHGRAPGEYLAKLGRVYVDGGGSWGLRLRRLVSGLEARHEPTTVILESRSGLHDVAAATVTDLDAQVLLFATDSDSTWTDYGILFRHWQSHDLASHIRERLSIVSALTPQTDASGYLRGFRERAWDLFRHVYDEVAPADESGDVFSFDLDDDAAPHCPIAIHWTRGLAAGTSLRSLGLTDPVAQAYAEFLARFDGLVGIDGGGETR